MVIEIFQPCFLVENFLDAEPMASQSEKMKSVKCQTRVENSK